MTVDEINDIIQNLYSDSYSYDDVRINNDGGLQQFCTVKMPDVGYNKNIMFNVISINDEGYRSIDMLSFFHTTSDKVYKLPLLNYNSNIKDSDLYNGFKRFSDQGGGSLGINAVNSYYNDACNHLTPSELEDALIYNEGGNLLDGGSLGCYHIWHLPKSVTEIEDPFTFSFNMMCTDFNLPTFTDALNALKESSEMSERFVVYVMMVTRYLSNYRFDQILNIIVPQTFANYLSLLQAFKNFKSSTIIIDSDTFIRDFFEIYSTFTGTFEFKDGTKYTKEQLMELLQNQ